MGCADCPAEGAEAEAFFQGRWYAYPPLRNAMIAGGIAGVGVERGETCHGCG